MKFCFVNIHNMADVTTLWFVVALCLMTPNAPQMQGASGWADLSPGHLHHIPLLLFDFFLLSEAKNKGFFLVLGVLLSCTSGSRYDHEERNYEILQAYQHVQRILK